jgi:hypothetical protein
VLRNCSGPSLLYTFFETIHFCPKAFKFKFRLDSWKINRHQEERAVVRHSRREGLSNRVSVTPHVTKPHDYVNHMFMRP